MSERDKLYKDFLSEQNPILRPEKHQLYKTKINLVTSQLRKVKKEYFNAFFKKTKIILRKYGKALGT